MLYQCLKFSINGRRLRLVSGCLDLTTKYMPQTTPNSAVVAALYFRSTKEKKQLKACCSMSCSGMPVFQILMNDKEITRQEIRGKTVAGFD